MWIILNQIFIPIWCITNIIVSIYKLFYFILYESGFRCKSLANWTLVISIIGNIFRIVFASTYLVIRFTKYVAVAIYALSGFSITATFLALFFWLNIDDLTSKPMYRYRYLIVILFVLIFVIALLLTSGGPKAQGPFFASIMIVISILSLLVGLNRIPKIYVSDPHFSKLRNTAIWMTVNGSVLLISAAVVIVQAYDIVVNPIGYTLIIFSIMASFNIECVCQLMIFHPTKIARLTVSDSISRTPTHAQSNIR